MKMCDWINVAMNYEYELYDWYATMAELNY